MSNDNLGTKEISLGCYQGIKGVKDLRWKDYYAVQTVYIPRIGKGTKKVEYPCQFCDEKVELTIRSRRLQILSCLGAIVVIALAGSLIYLLYQKQIWENYAFPLSCLTIIIALFIAASIAQRIEEVSISKTSMYESDKPKHKILITAEESISISGHRAYLVPLWSTSEWSSSEMNNLAATIQSELRCTVYLLKAVQVKGKFPGTADDYVVATALLACESIGVELDTEKDVISFRGGEYSPGVYLGVIIIEIK